MVTGQSTWSNFGLKKTKLGLRIENKPNNIKEKLKGFCSNGSPAQEIANLGAANWTMNMLKREKTIILSSYLFKTAYIHIHVHKLNTHSELY